MAEALVVSPPALGRGSDWLHRHARSRVNDLSSPPQLEAGPDIRGWSGLDRVAIVVHWSADGSVSRSVSQYVQQLTGLGYKVAVCSTSEAPAPLSWRFGRPADVAVYRRPNIGIDFGTWGAMLSSFPRLRAADKVLLLNDSLVGPFASIDPIITSFEEATCDVWGLISSNQMSPHFQSHFVGYKQGVLTDAPLVHFWTNVRLQPTRDRLISRYERGLSRLALRVGYRLGVGFPWHWVVQARQNPTILGWRRLLQYGFPWVKRELVWKPYPHLTDAADVAEVVRQRFGEDVHAWL
jgi:lipopolysaccharide biosynthesis protein